MISIQKYHSAQLSVAAIVMLMWFSAQPVAIAHPAKELESDTNSSSPGAVVSDRIESERQTAFNPYVFSAHKQNYVLPISYSSSVNSDVYEQFNEDLPEFINSEEVKFQLSLKVQLNEHDLLFNNDALFVGFTLKAWWQLYSKDVSSPFRETNYQPEVFYLLPLSWRPLDSKTTAVFGFEHQSNGQIQGFSRSWNRVYAALLIERGDYFGLIRPWYRLPEEEKATPNNPRGDDNPDILDFMGHGEMLLGWRGNRYELSANLRNNFSTGKGAAELSLSFPLFSRFRGVVQYFNGYGESLIDYDHYQQRLGVGVLLSNLF